MKKSFYYMSLLLGLVLGMTMFTACGGGDDDDEDDAPNSGINGKSSGKESVAKDVLTPGIYFCLEATNMHVQCTDAIALGDNKKVADIINNYGYCDNSAWKVVKGDMIGVMGVYGSLKRPTGNGTVVISTQTYNTTTVYYYIYEDEDCNMFPWEEFKGNNTTYENGMFVQRNTFFTLSQNGTIYYKKVK